MRLFVVFALVLAAASAQGTTTVAFGRALPGKAFTLRNPQPTTVTGRLYVHPRFGAVQSTKSLAFTLAPFETKTIENLLAALETTTPSVIRVEADDVLAGPLHIAIPGQSASSSFVYTPGGADPTILVAMTSGTVRVKVFATNASMIAAYSDTFTRSADGTIALQASAILRDTPVSNGVVVVEPVVGAAAVTTTYVPGRVRSVAHPGLDPVYFSIQSPGCAGSVGARATVTFPVAGMTYSWSALNATPAGSTSDTLFPFTLGTAGYAMLRLVSRLDDTASTSTTALIKVAGKPSVINLSAPDVSAGKQVTITWTPSANATTAKIYGTDFPSTGQTIDPAAAMFSYVPSGSDTTKWVEVVLSNECGDGSQRTTFDVEAPAPSGSITAPELCVFGGSGCEITVVVENVPADVEWKLRSAIGNPFGGNNGFGSGTFQRVYGASNEYGLDTITLEVDGVVIGSAQIQMFSGGFEGIGGRTQVLGTSRAFNVTMFDLPPTKRWTLRSAGGSTFDNPSGMGSGAFPRTVHFQTAINGTEKLRLEVDGVLVALAEMQLVSGSIQADPTTIVLGATSNLTVTVTNLEIPGSREWVLRSAKGNTFDAVSGLGSGTFHRTFHAVVRGLDTLSLEADGIVITTMQIQVN